ncbi:thiamine phosphate synthase [Methylophaga sp.]|uniref:thiamine phosphate synthase n=1 Tax=Methylophaga sp. TaxID=2024840 RepID=UPI003F6A15A3
MAKPAVLLIGGLDPQGCAGVAADIATVQHHDCHPLPLITAMTEQSSVGLTAMGAVNAEKLLAQYHNCVEDFDIKAIKIGLIPNVTIAETVLTILQQHPDIPVVVDPVLTTSSGGVTVDNDVQSYIVDHLFPYITLLTPNIPELHQLSAVEASTEESVAALRERGLEACLVKGGHSASRYATEFFVSELASFYCYQDKHSVDVRGTGCVLASAIASQLAAGQDIRDAVVLAKAYISRGIRLSQRSGPYHVITHSQFELELQDIPKLCYRSELIGQQYSFPSCPERLGIYPVVDNVDWVQKLVEEDIETIQLRIKDKADAETKKQIKMAISYLDKKSVNFFVNDHWQLAIEHGAYGVHLGQEDLHDANLGKIADAGLRLGISTHSYWELARALAVNPSYVALGPIFETTSKQMPFSPQGIERLHQWVHLLKGKYPVVAIGGINHERAKQLKTTGVGSVAMITAITLADDYRQTTQDLKSLWQ